MTRFARNLTIVRVNMVPPYTYAEQTMAEALEHGHKTFSGSLARVDCWQYVGRELDGHWQRVGEPALVSL